MGNRMATVKGSGAPTGRSWPKWWLGFYVVAALLAAGMWSGGAAASKGTQAHHTWAAMGAPGFGPRAAAAAPVAAADGVYQVRVVVSEQGFDPPVVEVPQGQEVELTFVYGDTHLADDNPHILRIEGLGLTIESGEISRSIPETTVRFVAEQSGDMRYVCVIRCVGHGRLRDGRLQVVPAAGTVAASPPVQTAPASATSAPPPIQAAQPPVQAVSPPAQPMVASHSAATTAALAQQAAGTYQVRVVVSERGFDPPVVDVPEGQAIELTFVYGDTHLADDNPHILLIEGLNIESGEISKSTPETTVRFTAQQSGRIKYVCKLYCIGHGRLQDGYVNVRPAVAAGTAVVAQPVKLQLAASSPDVVGAPALLRAELAAADGAPLEGMGVRFEQQVTLINPGWVTLGTARTDSRGAATLEFLPFGTPGDQPVRAVFEGSARYEPAAAAGVLKVAQVPPAWHPPAQPFLADVRYWLLVAGVAGVWSTLGYVGLQLLAIWRAR